MSVQDCKRQFFETVLDLLWKQWTALGVPGQTTVHQPDVILDPEALLIFSAGFARYDQRLYDLILDWLQIHSSQINIQRLKALHAKAVWKNSASLGYICAVAAETDPVRWRKTAADFSAAVPKPPETLFRDQDNVPEKFIPKRDPLARRSGFLRNIRRKSGKIPAGLPQNAASVLLQMRGLLGISARAETILILLDSPSCKVQDIADRSGFTWKSIQDVLAELMSGGFVSAIDGSTRGKKYFLNDPQKILRFFGIRTPVFWNWMNIYDSAGLFWQLCSDPLLEKVSEETFRNELQNLYREKLRKKLFASGCAELEKDFAPRIFPKLLRRIYR